MAVQQAQQDLNFWFQSRNFFNYVTDVLGESVSDRTSSEFETELHKFYPSLLHLLKNTPKNAADRQKLQNAAKSKESISFSSSKTSSPRRSGVQVEEHLVNEALILSDLFNLNELKAVELVLAGQEETASFPGFARGLCGVLCYFNSHNFLVQSLKCLLMGRNGRFWSYETLEAMRKVADTFTDKLWKDGLFVHLLELVSDFDLTKELEKLQQPNVKGLGNARHRKLVTELISGIYETLSECILIWCCQNPLAPTEFDVLAKNVRNLDLKYGFRKVEANLLCALLYAIDATLLESIDNKKDLNLVPFAGSEYSLNSYHKALFDSSYRHSDVESVVLWAWAVSLRMTAQHHIAEKTLENFDQDEEELLDRSLENQPFSFLRRSMFAIDDFHRENLWVQRVHSMVVQTIFYFKMKVKELRSAADEEIRAVEDALERGLPPPRILMNFQQFMLLIADLYENLSDLHLSEQFWCHPDAASDDSLLRTRYTPLQTALFKFVHSSGELLPAVLYVAYLKMIGSLANSPDCAAQAFELLRANGSYGGSQLSSVSLSHFFSALENYRATLKEHAGMKPVQISTEESQGLRAWLDLIAKIAANDETCRLIFVENGQWHCLKSCFGLLTCSVPLILKQGIWKFLAGLAKSETLSSTLWDALFQAGIVLPAADGKSGGLVQELGEIESRQEEYPNSGGLLEFLAEITGHGAVPESQMMGIYVEFLVQCVVTKFQNRAYKTTAEMWRIGRFSMEILWKLLRNLDVTVEGVRNGTAGCAIMTHMMNDGPVFRTVVSVLDEGVALLDQYAEFAGKREMELASLYALKLVHSVLVRQSVFLDCVRDAGVAVLTSRLDLLLQTLNPKNMEANYITRIACYTQYSAWLPAQCLAATSIVQCLAASGPSVQNKLVQYLTRRKDVGQRILSGFVDCLLFDNLETEPQQETESTDGLSMTEAQIRGKTALTILETIDRSLILGSGQPNLAYFLLGFDMKRPNLTHLEDPGVSGVQRNCLHSIIVILNTCVDKILRESAIGILCRLAMNLPTCEPTLRYLRTAHDLICQLSEELKVEELSENTESLQYSGSLMQLVAVEFFTLSAANQRSQVLRLAKIWMQQISSPNFDTSAGETTVMDLTTVVGGSAVNQISKLYSDSRIMQKNQKSEGSESKVMGVLKKLEFSVMHLDDPILQYFDVEKVSKLIGACSSTAAIGPVQCDVGKLHSLLAREIASLKGTSLGGHQSLIKQEVDMLLDHVVAFNKLQREAWAKIHCFNGWCELVEALFTRIPMDYLPVETLIEIGGALLACLLEKGVQSELLAEIGVSIGKNSVHLTTWLRKLFLSEETALSDTNRDDTVVLGGSFAGSGLSTKSTQYISLLDRTAVPRKTEVGRWKHLDPILPAFRLLIEFVLKPGDHRVPKTRVHLYGALLNFFHLTKEGKKRQGTQSTEDQRSPALDGWTLKDRISEDQWRILSRYQTELAELIAKDACDGSDITKTVALSLLSVILLQDALRDGQLIGFLANRGYIRHLVESVGVDDIRLVEISKNSTLPLRPLYIFQAKLALFTRSGMTDFGKSILNQHSLIHSLMNCDCWSLVPDEDLVRLKHKEETPHPVKKDERLEFEECLLNCWKKLKLIESKIVEKRAK